MIYVITEDDKIFDGHIGSRSWDCPVVNNIRAVQADGDELAQIISWGFPNNGSRFQTYYGDQAKYIAGNWK